MSQPDGFLQQLRVCGRPVFDAHAVAIAYLYGSRAAGRSTPLSDVDIAIVTSGSLPPRERLRLELALEVELAAAMGSGLEFDVRAINDAPLDVKGTVLTSGRLLYSRDDARRVEFEEHTRDLYFDFLPVLDFHREAFFARQRRQLREKGLL